MWFDYSGDPKDTCCSSFLILRSTFGIIHEVWAVLLLFNVIILLEGGFILVFTGSLGVWAAAKQNRGSTAGVRTIMITSVFMIIMIIMMTIIIIIIIFLFINKLLDFSVDVVAAAVVGERVCGLHPLASLSAASTTSSSGFSILIVFVNSI